MNATVHHIDPWRQLLASRAVDADGRPVCGCGAGLGDDQLQCARCAARHDADQELRERERDVAERRRSAMGRLPAWAWVDDRDDFGQAVQSPRLHAVAERWDPSRGSLVLSGPTGTGKTATAIRAVRRLVAAATAPRDPILRVRWVSAAELVSARRRHPLGGGEAPDVTSVIQAAVLVLDELGPEPPDTTIHDVLDARYLASRPTITTTGMTAGELRHRYGDATVRRMYAPHGQILEVR